MALSPKESGKFISELSENVKISDEGISKLGEKVIDETLSGKISVNNFSQNKVHPSPGNPWAVDWLFVVDTLNFSFWIPEGSEGWKVKSESGYFGLCLAINRALRENVDILNPEFYATISEKQLVNVLRSDTSTSIPLLHERVSCLQQSGIILKEKFGGSFLNCVKLAEGSAIQLVKIIVDNFKSFRDEADYKGHRVTFYKRAQILVGDIWSCYKGKDIGYFHDINQLTMFADYRVPQVLVLFGVLKYSDELWDKLKKDELLDNGSQMEVEIRGCSIHAVEMVKEYANSKLPTDKKVNSILLDHFLWDFRRQNAKTILSKGIKFHKCRCVYY